MNKKRKLSTWTANGQQLLFLSALMHLAPKYTNGAHPIRVSLMNPDGEDHFQIKVYMDINCIRYSVLRDVADEGGEWSTWKGKEEMEDWFIEQKLVEVVG